MGPAVLGALTVAALAAAFTSAPRSAGSGDVVTSATPVLSARRVPALLAAPVAAERLEGRLTEVLRRMTSQSCVVVVDDSGQVLAEERGDSALVPASVQKLATAVAVLRAFDVEHRLVTTVHGELDGGVVRGDLHLVGGGDPLLATAAYAARTPGRPWHDVAGLADAIAAAGVTEVTGAVVGDGTRHEPARYLPIWPARYAAQGSIGPLGALVVDDGFTAFPAATGDPARHAAAIVTDLLRERSVAVEEPARAGPTRRDLPEIARVQSPPMGELVEEMLRFSDTNTAELLVRELAVPAGEVPATHRRGLAELQRHLRGAGLPLDGVVVADGSGLALENRTSCRVLVSLLRHPETRDALQARLAVPGEPGTLEARLATSPSAGALRAKTGSLASVSSLAGAVRTAHGAELTFAYIANGIDGASATALAVQDALVEALHGADLPARDALGPAPA